MEWILILISLILGNSVGNSDGVIVDAFEDEECSLKYNSTYYEKSNVCVLFHILPYIGRSLNHTDSEFTMYIFSAYDQYCAAGTSGTFHGELEKCSSTGMYQRYMMGHVVPNSSELKNKLQLSFELCESIFGKCQMLLKFFSNTGCEGEIVEARITPNDACVENCTQSGIPGIYFKYICG